MSELQALVSGGQVSFSKLIFTHFAETNLTPSELTAYLFLSEFVQEHAGEPDLRQLAARANMRTADFSTLLSNLSSKGAIAIETTKTADGRLHDVYDVTPLLKKCIELEGGAATTATPAAQRAPSTARQLFGQIETEFGRPLSPIEQQTIRAWLREDHYNPELITLALREAVLNQAYSLKYMDRILISWEKSHLTTAAAVRQAQHRQDSL